MVDFIKYDIIGNFFLGLYEDKKAPDKPYMVVIAKLARPAINFNFKEDGAYDGGGTLLVRTTHMQLELTSMVNPPIRNIRTDKLEDYDNYRDEFYLAALNLKEYEIEDIIYE